MVGVQQVHHLHLKMKTFHHARIMRNASVEDGGPNEGQVPFINDRDANPKINHVRRELAGLQRESVLELVIQPFRESTYFLFMIYANAQ